MTDKNIRNQEIRDNRHDRDVHLREDVPAGYNLSWGSVIAGSVTFIAVFLVLSLIISALGFGMFSPNESQPLSGVGMSTGIATVIVLLLSFLAGGFVSGIASRKAGLLHGFLTWALGVFTLLFIVWSILSTALNAVTTVGGQVVDTATNVGASVASSAGDALSLAVDQAVQQSQESFAEVDTQELEANVEQILIDTEIPELQPGYLQGQIDQSINDIQEAGRQVILNPDTASATIDNLLQTLQDRAEAIANSADREAISNAVSANTDLTDAEAEEAVDNIYEALQTASVEAQEQINQATITIEETRVEVEKTIESGLETADDVTNTVSAGSIVVMIGLLIGLAITAFGGRLGVERSHRFWNL